MIRAITISREFGSGASSIARLLADRLNWRILDHDVIEDVFRAAQCSTAGTAEWQSDLWFRKLVQEVAWNGGVRRLAQGEDFSVRSEVIEEAARMGDCVIIGRGAQCILRGDREAFHVYLYAPLALRRERVAQNLGDPAELEPIIATYDGEQAQFVREHFDLDWRDPQLYDLMIDTRHGYRAAADAIFAAAGLRGAAY